MLHSLGVAHCGREAWALSKHSASFLERKLYARERRATYDASTAWSAVALSSEAYSESLRQHVEARCLSIVAGSDATPLRTETMAALCALFHENKVDLISQMRGDLVVTRNVLSEAVNALHSRGYGLVEAEQRATALEAQTATLYEKTREANNGCMKQCYVAFCAACYAAGHAAGRAARGAVFTTLHSSWSVMRSWAASIVSSMTAR